MKRVLVVVDYQNDFVDGSLATDGGKEIHDGIVSLVERYLDEKQTVVATLDTHHEDYLESQEGCNLPICHCMKGTKGHTLYGKLNDLQDKMICLEKATFGSMELGQLLKGIQPTEIAFCGLVTDICVISNVVIAKNACPEARVIVYKDLTEGLTKDKKAAALDVMQSLQVEIK